MHVHCLHWLMSPGLLLLSDYVNPRLVKWHQWRAPIWHWESDIAPTVSTRLSRPCSGILADCGCTWMSYIATLNSTTVSSCFVVLAFSSTHPTSTPLPPTPYIHWPILRNFMKKSSKTSKYQPLSTCQFSCTKANR